MEKFKFLPPYRRPNTVAGTTTFPESKKRSGVYLIKEDGKIVYVGYSTNDLYRTMYRHFQQWNSRRQVVVTYADKMNRYYYTVRIVYCTRIQAEKLEKMLILKHQPRDNENKYDQIEVTASYHNVLDAYSEAPVEYDVPF